MASALPALPRAVPPRRSGFAGVSALALMCMLGREAVAAPDAGAGTPPRGDREPRSHFFPKLIANPSLLSEQVRARLQERAAARSAEPQLPALEEEGAVKPARDDARASEARVARLRRMVSFETLEGVTVLSNRGADGQERTSPSRPLPPPPAPPVDTAQPAPAGTEAAPSAPARPEKHGPRPSHAPRREDPPTRWPWLVLIGLSATALGAWVSARGRDKPRVESVRR